MSLLLLNSTLLLCRKFQPGNVTDGCNDKCYCSNYYNPVCYTSDHVNFYSPCHAGCRSIADDFEVDNKKIKVVSKFCTFNV